MTVTEAKTVIKNKVGLEEQTLNFLELYKYGDELLIKIAEALNK